MGRPLLSRLRRRFAPLRGTQRRCAALCFAPPGRYAPCALRAQPFWKHEKNATFFKLGPKGKAPRCKVPIYPLGMCGAGGAGGGPVEMAVASTALFFTTH